MNLIGKNQLFEGHSLLVQLLRELRQEFCRDGFIYEQCFHRIANAGALALRIDDDLFGHLQIGVGIDVNMADAFVMFNDRHL